MLAGDRAIHGNRLFLTPERAEYMTDAQAVADHMRRVGSGQSLEDRKLLLQAAKPAQRLGTKRLDRLGFGNCGIERIEFGERQRGTLRLVEQFRKRGPAGDLIRRFGNRATKQRLGNFKFAQISRLKPEHRQGQHVAIILGKQATEQRMGARRIARLQRLGSRAMAGVAGRYFEREMLRHARIGQLAKPPQRATEHTQRRWMIGIGFEHIACLRLGRCRIGGEQLPRLSKGGFGVGNDRSLHGSRSGRARHS